MQRDNQVRMIALPEHTVLDWFASAVSGWPATLTVPRVLNLPADAKVDGLYYDHYMRMLYFRVSHPSFDPVPDGQELPRLCAAWRWESVTVADCDRPLVVED